jgi:hypothetical protein
MIDVADIEIIMVGQLRGTKTQEEYRSNHADASKVQVKN